jgi:hypothetical protein
MQLRIGNILDKHIKKIDEAVRNQEEMKEHQ